MRIYQSWLDLQHYEYHLKKLADIRNRSPILSPDVRNINKCNQPQNKKIKNRSITQLCQKKGQFNITKKFKKENDNKIIRKNKKSHHFQHKQFKNGSNQSINILNKNNLQIYAKNSEGQVLLFQQNHSPNQTFLYKNKSLSTFENKSFQKEGKLKGYSKLISAPSQKFHQDDKLKTQQIQKSFIPSEVNDKLSERNFVNKNTQIPSKKNTQFNTRPQSYNQKNFSLISKIKKNTKKNKCLRDTNLKIQFQKFRQFSLKKYIKFSQQNFSKKIHKFLIQINISQVSEMPQSEDISFWFQVESFHEKIKSAHISHYDLCRKLNQNQNKKTFYFGLRRKPVGGIQITIKYCKKLVQYTFGKYLLIFKNQKENYDQIQIQNKNWSIKMGVKLVQVLGQYQLSLKKEQINQKPSYKIQNYVRSSL